jgi:pimeloyl-ACP methyl ester carboxylesterase
MKAQGEMLGSFIDALGLDQVDLVGNDTGGGIVQVYGARNPERVRSIVLTNCEARDVLPSPSDIAQLVTDLGAKGELAPIMVQQSQDYSIARSKVGLGAGFSDPERLTDDDIRGYIEPHQSTLESARKVEEFINSMDNADLIEIIPLLERLDAPMLCVWGTADVVFPLELANWLRDTVPGCREVVEVEGGELFWPGERPDELVEPMRRFWAETAERAGAAAS